MNALQQSTAPKRGRKTKTVEFPVNQEFRIKELAEQLNVSVPLVYMRVKTNANVKLVREVSNGGKGRKAGIYIYTPAN